VKNPKLVPRVFVNLGDYESQVHSGSSD
jgi:hypothetical protein